MDIESNSYFSYPYYPLTLIIPHNLDKLLAIKAMLNLSILSLHFDDKYDVN